MFVKLTEPLHSLILYKYDIVTSILQRSTKVTSIPTIVKKKKKLSRRLSLSLYYSKYAWSLRPQSHRGKDRSSTFLQPLKISGRQFVVRGWRKVFEVGKKVVTGCYRLWSAGGFCSCIEYLLPTKLVGRI